MDRLDVLSLLVVCAVTIAVLGKDISRGAMIDPDAAAHAMDGVLIHDWIVAGPDAWLAPMRFAREQYGHYPTLGIGGHYPPGFAAFEALFFMILGVSTTSARWCVVFFGVVAACGCFCFLRCRSNRATSLLGAILLVTIPASIEWGRQIMLEIPLIAALIWAAVAFLWYTRDPNWTRFSVACGLALLALAFKQSGIFLICAFAGTLGVQALRMSALWKHAICGLALAIAAFVAVLYSLDEACLKTVSGYATVPLLSIASVTFYPAVLPEQVGWIVLFAALMGFLISFRKMQWSEWLLSAWLLIALVMVTATSLKTPRFSYVLVFPIVVWAAIGVGHLLDRNCPARFRPACAGAIAFAAAAVGVARPVAEGPDFRELVKESRNGIENEVILFSGLRDGDFVFAVREQISWRQTIIIRGSKLFYTCVAPPSLDMVSYVQSEEELAEVMRRFSFREVFVERENLVGTQQDEWLRTYLRESGDYCITSTKVIDGRRIRGKRLIHVDRYTLTRPMEREVSYFDIPIPRTGEAIRISLPTPAGNSS